MTERVSLLGQAAGFKPSAPAGPTHQERQAAQDRIIDLLKGGVMNDPLHTGRP
jgi:hypothetical protein